jgi:phenylpropionate dioxygenase-like ring-hydroxylating dioxygenase large terminal subunit
MVREVEIRSASIVIVRGKDMKIRAFHNICSHRGMKLVWDRQGRGGKFSCPYHAWVYNAEGALTNIPDEACFPHVDKQQSGLTPVACDVWENFVFINLDPQPAQTLVEFLGPLTQALNNAPFEAYSDRAGISFPIHANWKLALEAQSEAYHASALHAKTVAKMLASRDNPFVHVLAWKPLGAHRSQSIPMNPNYVAPASKPVQKWAFGNAVSMVMGDDSQNQSEIGFASQPGANPAGSNLWSNEQFGVYPNFIFQISVGGWWLHRVWPIDEGNCRWEVVYHSRPARSLRERFSNQYSLAFNRDTLTEDNNALERQQPIIASGGAKRVNFGDGEVLCRYFAAVNDAITDSFAKAVAAE